MFLEGNLVFYLKTNSTANKWFKILFISCCTQEKRWYSVWNQRKDNFSETGYKCREILNTVYGANYLYPEAYTLAVDTQNKNLDFLFSASVLNSYKFNCRNDTKHNNILPSYQILPLAKCVSNKCYLWQLEEKAKHDLWRGRHRKSDHCWSAQ